MKAAEYFDTLFLYRPPVDMRKQINGLAYYVQQHLNGKPFERILFAFANRDRNLVKAIYWRKTGFALWMFRLEKNRFYWPRGDGVIALNSQEFTWLLDGVNLAKIQPHKPLKYSNFS